MVTFLWITTGLGLNSICIHGAPYHIHIPNVTHFTDGSQEEKEMAGGAYIIGGFLHL